MKKSVTFEEIFEQNERRIHYHIYKLNIRDPHKEFYQEGLCAMWNAYKTYQPDKGPMATYFNFIIRHRLIDLLRKQKKEYEHKQHVILESRTRLDDGNHLRHGESSNPILTASDVLLHDPYLLQNLKTRLTDNQWKWLYFHIIKDMHVKNIATQENTTIDAVKSWGRQVRKKLRDEDFRNQVIGNV